MNLVTGGTGFLGAYIIRHLLEQGEQVKAIKRTSSKMDLVQPFVNRVEWIESDLFDIVSLSKAFEEVTHVYHSAAMVSFDPKDKYDMLRINVQGTANVVNCCIDANIEKLVHVSSNAAIGRDSTNQNINENATWNSSKYNSNYALSKYESELEVWRGIAEGLNAAIINPSLIIGSGFLHEGTSAFIPKIENGLKYNPTGTSGFIDVRDVANIAYLLMHSDITAERFILSAETISYKDFFSMISKNLGVVGPTIEAKPWMVGMVWRLEKLKCLLSRKKPMITKETATNSMNKYNYENKKIIEALNYSFHSIEQTVHETVEQYLNSKTTDANCAMLPSLF